jgi:hypothetical protein
MSLQIPIGLSDFRALREQGMEYVDKSHLLREVLDTGAQALLLPRPRRFGKSLNLSMLRYFFEQRAEDLSHLFDDLSIWQAGEGYRAHFQRYPVIYLTFKDIKPESFEPCWAALRKTVERLFDEHRALLSSGSLSEQATRDFRAVLDGTAGRDIIERALVDLSAHLHRHHGQKVVILIDEYATFRQWMRARLRGHGGDLGRLNRGLFSGDAELLEEQLQAFVTNLLSYHDAGQSHPEQVYQAFALGLLATLEPAYRVRSNRESGQGRPDVLIVPAQPGAPGVVLELKVIRPGKKTPEQALAEGLSQIQANDDAAELRAAGAAPVHAFAVAFDGKQVWARAAG